jgi:hypothetical protein
MHSFIFWLILSSVFILCAYVQLNDPDPFGWITMYTSNAILLGMRAWGIYKRIPSLCLLIISLIGAYYFWPSAFDGLYGDMTENPNIEYARESMGLFLIATTQGFVIYISEYAHKSMQESSS